MSSSVMVPISIGDLYDKISILEIKLEFISDKSKRRNVALELKLLNEIADTLPPLDGIGQRLRQQLKQVNKALWDTEEQIRHLERVGDYGTEFVATARAIHRNNDMRAELKRQLNLLSGSLVVEEKSYALPTISADAV